MSRDMKIWSHFTFWGGTQAYILNNLSFMFFLFLYHPLN